MRRQKDDFAGIGSVATGSVTLHETSSVKARYLRLYEIAMRCRLVDEKMAKLVRQNRGGSFHISANGHELVGAVCATALEAGKDWGLPYYRDRAFAIGLGSDLVDLFGIFMGRAAAHHSRGRMMPEHFAHKELRIPCQSSCVGSQFLQAVGVAKSAKLRKSGEVVYVSAGDGATSQGEFHEMLNFACLHELPLIVVIQDNGWAISVPIEEQTAGGSILPVARGYHGLSVFDVDGGDVEALTLAATEAAAKARHDKGPSLILAKVPRLGPHSISDDQTKYKSQEQIEEEMLRDPLPRYEQWLLEMGLVQEDELTAMKERLKEEIEQKAREADALPFPDPATVMRNVFAESDETIVENDVEGSGQSIVMVDALNHALKEEMARDERVIVFGQDVAHGKGGVFGVTRGLTAQFGKERCFNTPLAEMTIIGLATGLSQAGFRPVAEIQFADYVWPGFNQLINEIATIRYRSDGEWSCPAVIRMPSGGYIQGGPYHSQSIEAFLAHAPGLKVVIPSNSADAKRLLKTAIRDEDPVVFLEHKALYRQRLFSARPEPGEEELLPFGRAKVVKSGDDMTLVAWGMTVVMGAEVVRRLAEEGISVELIDLRTLVPLDMETVLTSVRKTGKLLIAHEAPGNGGFGAEIAARVAAEAFHYLDAPIARLTGKECPVPYSKPLEDAVLPQTSDLEAAVRKLIRF